MIKIILEIKYHSILVYINIINGGCLPEQWASTMHFDSWTEPSLSHNDIQMIPYWSQMIQMILMIQMIPYKSKENVAEY